MSAFELTANTKAPAGTSETPFLHKVIKICRALLGVQVARAMRTGIACAQLRIGMTGSAYRRRPRFMLFREKAVGRIPAGETQITEHVAQRRPKPGEQYDGAVPLCVAQKMFEPFDAHDVGISYSLEAQHEIADSLLLRTRLDRFEMPIEFRRVAKEKLTFEIPDRDGAHDGSEGKRSLTTPSGLTTSSVAFNFAARGTNTRIESTTPIRMENSTPISNAASIVNMIRPASYLEARNV